MKLQKILILCIATLFLFVAQKYANATWLNQGKNIIQKFQQDNIVKKPKYSHSYLTNSEIYRGLKDALTIGTKRVVNRLGRKNGFFKDKAIHIPLPNNLKKIKNILDRIGMAEQLNNLELKLNRAAEIATPKAKKLFINAIKNMTISDVRKIYNGPNNAATQYFKNKMSAPLKNEMRPIVERSLSKVQAVQIYNSIVSKYNSLPFTQSTKGDISTFVLNKTIKGIFYYLAKEEASIRENPAKRTTEILKKVFAK